jgi:hypothetical protein
MPVNSGGIKIKTILVGTNFKSDSDGLHHSYKILFILALLLLVASHVGNSITSPGPRNLVILVGSPRSTPLL